MHKSRQNRSIIRLICAVLALLLIIGVLPKNGFAVQIKESDDNPYNGKTISILGDSISTYTGVSNHTSYNSTIGKNAIYYTPGKLDVYQADTWWQQTIDALGMELLVNNSWSGSCVLRTRSNTVGAYVDRCVQLHNDTTGEDPDVIAVFMGTNDYSHFKSTLGTAEINYDALIAENSDGTFAYATPTTSCEAYAIMLHKMVNRYPNAEIFCMLLLPRRNPAYSGTYAGQPTAFNEELAKIIDRFGCSIVDLENCGITTEPANFDPYIADKMVHPGPAGMDKMTEALISAMLGKESIICDVSCAYTGVASSNAAATALIGGSYRTELTLTDGYSGMNVVVTMNGEDVTASAYTDGTIHIDHVTGDIQIVATALKTPAEYRWEMSGNSLVSTGRRENTLTLQGGSVSNGIMQNAYYSLAEQVVLRHDLPWAVEFKASGSWSGMVLSAEQASAASGNTYLFKTRGTNGLIAFGEYTGTQYQNYGIALSEHGVDTTKEHTYRLENRVGENGTNMVCLLVDGVEHGDMNNYFIAGDQDQGVTVDWLNGRDLDFSYIGANNHALNNCTLKYLQITECEHTYKNGKCTGCGAEKPSGSISLQYDDRHDVSGKTVQIIDAGTPVSDDTAVVALEGNTLRAVGVGNAYVRIDGVLYRVTVEKAKLNLVMVVGQSNSGNHFPNATSAVTCPPGTAYYWNYGSIEPEDYTGPSMGFHAPLLAELYAQSVATGEPVKNVLLWAEGYTSKNGKSVTAWAVEKNGSINTDGTDGAAQMVRDCLAYYEQRSDKYEIANKVVFCNHGTTDHAMDPQRYIRLFTAMWERLKAEGMDYLAFLRVRGAHSLYTPENADVYYNAASAAQFEMVRTREDMFMASTLTEAWTGPVNTSHSIDIRKYITVMQTYGQSANYSDTYGNKATYADGILTTTMKELYGSNNKVHYGIFGYGLTGADAAYNMYAALYGSRAPTITQTDSSGHQSAENICEMGSVQTLHIDEIVDALSFYPTCGSPAGTMNIKVISRGNDITQQVTSREDSTYGCIDTEALRRFLEPQIIVSYTYAGVTEQVKYLIQAEHPCSSGHNYTNGICTVCGTYYVNFQSASISLAGNIAINFYVELGQPILDDESAFMSFTLPDGTTKTAMLSDAEVSVKNGVTRYVFTCEVHAKQMADMVVAQMHLGDGAAVGDSRSYSVVTYAGYIIAHEDQYAAYPSLVNLLKAMLNYGAYSQIHFGYNVNNLANANLNLSLNDVTLGEVEAYRPKRAGSMTGLEITSVTLILRSETVLRFYYTLASGCSIEDYNFVVNGKAVRPIYNQDNGRYYVDVTNIAAKDLDREYGVTVTNKAGTESLSVIASAMSYVYQVIASPSYFTEDVKAVVKAMYAYNIAANAYFK